MLAKALILIASSKFTKNVTLFCDPGFTNPTAVEEYCRSVTILGTFSLRNPENSDFLNFRNSKYTHQLAYNDQLKTYSKEQ